MEELFYRVHWQDCPEFSAENAQSKGWGENAGDMIACVECDGTGYLFYGTEHERECPDCEEGFVALEVDPGYSCCGSAESLISYFETRGGLAPDQAVVIFTGQRVGNGPDGEPLAVPDMAHVEWTTWGALEAQVTA